MNVLNPFYLLGLLAVLVPLWLHLRKKPPSEEQRFSSLIFLEESPQKKTQRRKLDELLLLLLRCAILGLLALLFARPFLRNDDLVDRDGTRRILVLLDESASMQRDGLWEKALGKIEDLAATTDSGDELALHTFSNRTRSLLDYDEWRGADPNQREALLTERLAEQKPGWRSTELGRVLVEAAELIRESEQAADDGEEENGAALPGRLEVHLFCDLQSGGGTQSLQSFPWPKEVELVITELEAKSPGNASIHLIGGRGHPGAPEPVRVRVANDRLAKARSLSLVHEQTKKKVAELRLEPGASKVITLPELVTGSGSVLLEGDDHLFDNRIYFALHEARPLRLVVVGDDQRNDPESPLFYLERAFPEAGLLRPEVHQWTSGEAPVDPDLIAILGTPPSAVLPGLKKQLSEGRRALCLLRAESDHAYLAQLGAGSVSGEGSVRRYALLQDLDFDSLLLQPFAESRTRDFSKIRFWKYRRWEAPENARILANFDTGDPAWGVVPIGEGRLFLFTAGWQPRDSQLALSTKFVPLLHSLVREAGDARAEAERQLVGEPFAEEELARVIDPEGKALSAEDFSAPNQTGLYQLERKDGTSFRVAVHLDPRESETIPVSREVLTALNADENAASDEEEGEEALAASASPRRNAQLESRQKIWRWLLLGAILFFLAESWWSARRPKAETQAA